tara:strand:+ start:122 stop:307 length:186 start_codon:yes stop_codon:yes gene_type:complete
MVGVFVVVLIVGVLVVLVPVVGVLVVDVLEAFPKETAAMKVKAKSRRILVLMVLSCIDNNF